MKFIETERLILREWLSEDIDSLVEINQDPKVVEFLAGPRSEEETREMVEKIQKHFKKHGFGLFACVVKETSECIGFVGLNIPDFDAPFMPAVEIGWRISSKVWGKGYAPEAAKAVLDAGFMHYGLKEIVSFTVPANERSIRVMEKIGMKRDPKGDFQHPNLPDGHPLKHHVLYRMKKDQLFPHL